MKLEDEILAENHILRIKISDIQYLQHIKQTNRKLKKKLRGLKK